MSHLIRKEDNINWSTNLVDLDVTLDMANHIESSA